MILHALSEIKTATRGQLAESTGLSQPTVNAIMEELEQRGVVRSGNFAASSGGRRPQCYTLQTDYLRTVAVQLHPYGFTYAVLTIDGEVVQRNTWTLGGVDNHLQVLITLLQTLLKQDSNIQVVSIGVPGVVGPGGVLYAIPQIPSLEGVALANILETQCKLPVYVENDMNLVALGSTASRNGKTESDMVFIHIGEGVGAGIVIGGRIIRGFSSFAGEIAHMINESNMNESSQTLEYLLAQADSIPQKAQLVAGVVINTICLLNPPVIAFGGSLASEEMLRHLRNICEKHLPLWTIPHFQLMANESAAYEKGLLTSVYDVLSKSRLNSGHHIKSKG